MNESTLLHLANRAIKEENPYPSPLFPPSPYYRFLKLLAQELQPRLSVELGVCGGGGSLHLALGNPQGRVVGVDMQYDHPDQLRHIYSVCPNFVFWQGDSVEDAPKIVSDYGQPQLIFVDTTHTYDQTLAEFEAWHPYLADGWVMCFDDLRRAEMGNIWDVLPGPKLRLDELHPTAEGGFGVVWSE